MPIELIALAQGMITKLEGVIPNSLLHVALAAGFLVYATGMKDLRV